MSNYTKLVLSGGGIYGFQLLGAVNYFENNIDFKKIIEFSGTSVGSMLCYLLAIGYNSTEIITMLLKTKVFDKIKHFNVMQMVEGGGATSFSPIQELIETLTISKIGRFLTLSQLRKDFGKTFTCVTYDLTKNKRENLHPDTHPDLPCITAVRLSSTVPFIFPPYLYDGSQYVDGGLVCNFPADLISDSEGKCLGIYLFNRLSDKTLNKNFDLVKFAVSIMTVPIHEATHQSVLKAEDKKGMELIRILKPVKAMFKFDISSTEKLNLFSNGFNAARDQYLK